MGEGLPSTALALVRLQWFNISQSFVQLSPACGLLPIWQDVQLVASRSFTIVNKGPLLIALIITCDVYSHPLPVFIPIK
jgi:hypothetical protein